MRLERKIKKIAKEKEILLIGELLEVLGIIRENQQEMDFIANYK
jgi:hypothetical protein